MPVLVAPMSAMLMAHKEGEPATARAAVAAKTSMVCFFFTLPFPTLAVLSHALTLLLVLCQHHLFRPEHG